MTLWESIKELYWDNKIMNQEQKEAFFYLVKGMVRGKTKARHSASAFEEYTRLVMDNQRLTNSFSVDYPREPQITLRPDDPKLVAYYLPQYYPNPYNDKWWGKGSTEWTNTTKAMPQYLGQYQPRLPGELGFYDLRIQDNIRRQVELARFYGIYAFCFYYYWFDGVRLLDLPFDNFVNDPELDFPFFICWANESWTTQWSGSSWTTLIEQRKSVDSYKKFIEASAPLFTKENYFRINGKAVLQIYRVYNIPSPKEVLAYWREYVEKNFHTELYIIGCLNRPAHYKEDYLSLGFDAISEFGFGPQEDHFKEISKEKQFLCDAFYGSVYDYGDFVENKRYFAKHKDRCYRSVIPMWDNTARKQNKGIIMDGATPTLYKEWLKDMIIETKNNNTLDDSLIFLFAWNEWAEGAYLEPDLKWQYGYLEATKEAIMETRANNNEHMHKTGGALLNRHSLLHATRTGLAA